MPQLAFEKKVVFGNPRLAVLYYSLYVGIAAVLVIRAMITDMVYREVPVGRHIQFSMWETGATLQGVEQVVAENLQSDFCQAPEQLAYQWDAAGEHMYDGYRCYDVCSYPRSGECLNPKETYVKESATQIFFATEIADTWDGEDTKYRFVPMTEALGIQFAYQFSVPMNQHGGIPGGDTSKGSSPEGVLTVMLDAEGEVLEVIKPSPYVNLPLTRMMELAGDRNRLEDYNEAAGPNYLHPDGSDERARGPSYRISGSEIVLNTNCYNKHMIDLGSDPDTGEGYASDHVCYMTASFRDSQWVAAEQVHLTDQGRMLHRYFHGVRVSIQRGGTFRVLDPNAVFAAVVDAIVLLGVPAKIVLFIMLNCLGALSKIYRRALCEPMNIMDEIGALAVRLMGQSEWFVELEDTGDGAGGGAAQRGISRKRMEERLRQALMAQGDRIDSHELKELVSVCFSAVTDRHQIAKVKKHAASSEEDPEKSFSTVSSMDEGPEGANKDSISLGNFIVACSSNEVVEVDSIVELFDRDRQVGLLERLFMPSDIANRGRITKPSADEPSKDESWNDETMSLLEGAGLRTLTLEQRKVLSLENELRVQEFTSWKDKEASEAIKAIELLQLQVSKMTGASSWQPWKKEVAQKEAKSTSSDGVPIDLEGHAAAGMQLPGQLECDQSQGPGVLGLHSNLTPCSPGVAESEVAESS